MNLVEEIPWKKLTAKENHILFRFLTNQDFSYVFQWTDLIDLYQEKLTPGHITKRWNLMNKAVETELDGQIEAIESGLNTPLSIQFGENGTIGINFNDIEHETAVLKWQFECQKMPSGSFSQQIVKPALRVTNYQMDLNVSNTTNIMNVLPKLTIIL